MKIQVLAYSLFFLLILNSCNIPERAESKTSVAYNDQIISQYDFLEEAFDKKNKQDLSAEENANLSQPFFRACDKSTKIISKMGPHKGDYSLRNGMLNYIKNFKQIIQKDCREMDSIYYSTNEFSEEQTNRITQLENEINKKLNNEVEKFLQIQDAFVERHHYFIVKPTP